MRSAVIRQLHDRLGQATTLADFDFRGNAIGFLRLLFAAVVVWSHAYGIGGFGGDPIYEFTRSQLIAGFLAVGGFFVLSGFLITRSYETVNTLGRFIWHRFLRIFPAYWVCLIVTAFVFAPVAFRHENGTLAGFLAGPDSPWSYITRNAWLVVTQDGIRGSLRHLPSPAAFNGSLWTLQWEFLCYVAVAALGVAGVLRRNPVIIGIIAACFFGLGAFLTWREPLPGMNVAGGIALLLAYFAVGSYAYSVRAKIPMNWALTIIATVALLIALPTRAQAFVVLPCFAYLVLFTAMKLPIRSFDRRVDLSYGLYIYAYPVQQLLVLYGVAAFGLGPYFIAALAIALSIAAGSWFGVERPALALKNAAVPPRAAAWLRSARVL